MRGAFPCSLTYCGSMRYVAVFVSRSGMPSCFARSSTRAIRSAAAAWASAAVSPWVVTPRPSSTRSGRAFTPAWPVVTSPRAMPPFGSLRTVVVTAGGPPARAARTSARTRALARSAPSSARWNTVMCGPPTVLTTYVAAASGSSRSGGESDRRRRDVAQPRRAPGRAAAPRAIRGRADGRDQHRIEHLTGSAEIRLRLDVEEGQSARPEAEDARAEVQPALGDPRLEQAHAVAAAAQRRGDRPDVGRVEHRERPVARERLIATETERGLARVAAADEAHRAGRESIDARIGALDVVDEHIVVDPAAPRSDEVGHDRARRGREGPAERTRRRHRTAKAAGRAAPADDLLEPQLRVRHEPRGDAGRGAERIPRRGRAPRRDVRRAREVAGVLGFGDEPEALRIVREQAVRHRPERRRDGRRSVRGPERDDERGDLVHPVGTDELAHRVVDEAGVERRRGRDAGIGKGQELPEHRAGIPVDVPEPALAVLPAGAPGDPGDHDERASGPRERQGLREERAVIA